MFDKLKDRINQHSSSSSSSPQIPLSSSSPITVPSNAPTLSPPSQAAIYRYRAQRGINLGSLFVCEKWITPSPFASAVHGASADLDIALGPNGKEAFEKHWDTFQPSSEEWDWISSHGFNTIRLPIAWYHLPNRFLDSPDIADLVSHTDFAKPLKAGVWDSVWNRIREVVNRAESKGLGVLIDLHAGVGGQNADAHCGISSPAPPRLFKSKKNTQLTVECLKFLAGEFRDVPNIVGLELLNEPANDSALEGWYKEAIREVANVSGEGLPLYISDAWDTAHYASTSTLASLSPSATFPLAIDHHLYRCFTSSDTSKLGTDHAASLSHGSSFAEQFQGWSDAVGGALIVGEFSAALGGGSIPKGADASEGDRQKREWLRAELGLLDGIGREGSGGGGAAAGWFFWTLKKEDGWDNGWSAKDAMRSELLPDFVGKRAKRDVGDGGKDGQIKAALDSHVSYWTSTSPNQTFEHERFHTGLQLGWTDAAAFIQSSGQSGAVSTLGFWGWTMKRRREEHLKEWPRSKVDMVWEFEHGYKQGVLMANKLLVE